MIATWESAYESLLQHQTRTRYYDVQGEHMADKLKELFDQLPKDFSDFQIYQFGFTAAAVSMRQRALKVAQDNKDRNVIINGIGSLPDIPQE